MHFHGSQEMREWDRRTIAERGVPGLTLMNRAGAAVARVVMRMAALRGSARVALAAGRGNNGGDAFVAARCLHEDGLRVEVLLACPPDVLRGDARGAWEAMLAAGVPWRVLAEPAAWLANEATAADRAGVVVDGLLGTGSEGAPRGAIAGAIRWINGLRPRSLVVAVDLPSGLHADTGKASDPTVIADATVTFAAPKSGFQHACAWEFLGHVEVVDIGLPAELEPPCTGAGIERFIGAPAIRSLLPRRGRGAHKGDFGHLLVVGGSYGLSGAPALAALGALRGGAGLVTAAIPESCLGAMAVLAPGAMARTISTADGAMTASGLTDGLPTLERFDVVLAGPGMSAAAGTAEFVQRLLRSEAPRLVLDADALNVMTGRIRELYREAGAHTVILTPHPGEAARLLGCTAAQVQADRLGAARQLAADSRAVVVLKGAGTVVCAADGTAYLNLTGNPGMATGGSGDILAGLIAGVWAQGVDPVDAARLGVYLHGTAGDLAAWLSCEQAVSAEEIGRLLGPAWQWLARIP
jgi:NAD(P)H-hydrate epimerase